MWNINDAFSYAAIGADSKFAARVERLQKLCRPQSLAAANLCEAYNQISNIMAVDKELAEDKLRARFESEVSKVDNAKIAVQSVVARLKSLIDSTPDAREMTEEQPQTRDIEIR